LPKRLLRPWVYVPIPANGVKGSLMSPHYARMML
jgi:hypothetical protein